MFIFLGCDDVLSFDDFVTLLSSEVEPALLSSEVESDGLRLLDFRCIFLGWDDVSSLDVVVALLSSRVVRSF